MKYWLHRISHHSETSYPLLEKGYLTIGFSDFSEQAFIDDILSPDTGEKRWNVLEQYFRDEWGEQPRTRHNLWRFIEGFKTGDWVVVPTWWGQFSIYEIISDKPQPISNLSLVEFKDWHEHPLTVRELIYREDNVSIDLGFYWQVKPIETGISRYEYANAALTARMKIRNTNACINDLQKNIEAALSAYKSNKPINLHSKIVENTVEHIVRVLKDELSPDKFERIVMWYFERVGASEVYIPSKNEKDKEGDADVIATFEPIKTIIYTQAKFHSELTPQWAVQQITDYKKNKENLNQSEIEAMDDDYSRISWVISTADGFNEETIKLAKEEKVQLIDGKKFATMLLEAGITNINKF